LSGRVEERVTLPQFRMLVVLSIRGATKLVALADRQTTPGNRRETLLQLTDEGRRTVEDVTARRRVEIAAIVERLSPIQCLALVEALGAFNKAGGEPSAPAPASATDDREPHPLGWGVDGMMAHDA
jgi:hypothetical protein